jgi:hypothetical protein
MNYYSGIRLRENPIAAIMDLLNNIDNIDDIITESMDNKEKKKPMCKEYRSKLNIRDITEEDDIEKLSCAICQDVFKIGEKALELPCKDSSHFFHIRNDDECPGIYPWIDEKNTCPVCRCDFPYEEINEPEPEPEGPPIRNINDISIGTEGIPGIIVQSPIRIINPGTNIIQNMLGEAMDQAFQEIEDRELNEAIKRSLED